MTPKKTKEIELEKMLEAILDAGITEEGLSSAFKQLKNKREEEKKREAAYKVEVESVREGLILAMLNYIETTSKKELDENTVNTLGNFIKKLLLDYESNKNTTPKINIKVLKHNDISEEMADKIIRNMLGRG